MSTKKSIRSAIGCIVAILMATVFAYSVFALVTFETTANAEVYGRIYEFEKDSHYEFSDSKDFVSSENADTYGTFSISGEVYDVTTRDGLTEYEVAEGNLQLFYYCDKALLDVDEDVWHLTDDKSKKIDNLKLDKSIRKGAIIIQTSRDRLNWVNVASVTDAFNDNSNRTEPIYETVDMQLINGCYYRMIVAYEQCIRTEDSNILFINTDKYQYRKIAEVYEFYGLY